MGDVEDRRPAHVAVTAVEHGVHVEGDAAEPGLKRRARDEPVELHREGLALLRREEVLEVEDPEAVEGGRVDELDEGRQVERLSAGPRVGQEVREQDVLARLQRVGVDVDQRQDGADDAGHELALVLGGEGVELGRRVEAIEEAHLDAGARARRVDRDVGPGAIGADLLLVDALAGESAAPGGRHLLAELGRGGALVLYPRWVDPLGEALWREVWPAQGEVGQVALGVDGDDRDVLAAGLLEEADTQAGLAAAGHPEDEPVGREVLRVVLDARAVTPNPLAQMKRHRSSSCRSPAVCVTCHTAATRCSPRCHRRGGASTRSRGRSRTSKK